MPRNVNDRERLIPNLEILGKLSRGDMLAAAGEDGRLVRKTNFLTQAWRKNETHDENLFTQIQAVLDTALKQLNEQDDEQGLANKYVQATRGLEVLLSTYRSKGSKEFAYTDRLSEVLKSHAAAIEAQSTGKGKPEGLVDLAKRAVDYVKDCRIRSSNVAGIYYGGGHQSRYFGFWADDLLLELFVRCESFFIRGMAGQRVSGVELRKQILTIMRMPGHRADKRLKLKKLLNDLLGDGGRQYAVEQLLTDGFQGVQGMIDIDKGPFGNQQRQMTVADQRIESARNAIQMRLGNCGEKAAVAATWLCENRVGESFKIARIMRPAQYDHSWVMIGQDQGEDSLLYALQCCKRKQAPKRGNYKHRFPRDTIVVDGWTDDCWGLRDWFNSACTPRQLYVRSRIRKCIEAGDIGGYEEVTMPQGRYQNFRLRFAHMPDWNWHAQGPTMVGGRPRLEAADNLLLASAVELLSNRSRSSVCSMVDAAEYAAGAPHQPKLF